MPPQGSEGTADWSNWARSVRLDMAALQQYAQAVYAASEAYLASLKAEDLAQEMDLTAGGLW